MKSRSRIYTAIAYEWIVHPPHAVDHDFTLILASCRAALNGEESELQHRVYHAKFPPAGHPLRLTDVSGTLGLLWQATDQAAKQKADSFERVLADTIVWSLSEFAFPSSESHSILIQGPLIPKLRGRHLYRGIDPSVPVYSVTFHVDWFQRIEAAQATFLKMIPSSRPQVGNVYPPKGIDRATRSWVCRLPGNEEPGEPLHFEVIANMWDCCEESGNGGWIDERRKEIENLTKTAHLENISGTEDIRLPLALALAVDEARSWKVCEEYFEGAFRVAEERLSMRGARDRRGVAEKIRKIFGEHSIKNVVDETGQQFLLDAATEAPARLDCDLCYSHMRDNWLDKDFRGLVERFVRQNQQRGRK